MVGEKRQLNIPLGSAHNHFIVSRLGFLELGKYKVGLILNFRDYRINTGTARQNQAERRAQSRYLKKRFQIKPSINSSEAVLEMTGKNEGKRRMFNNALSQRIPYLF